MENKIEIGDEVQRYSDDGVPQLGTRFIVTDMGDDYLAGIDFGGEIYVFQPDEDEDHYRIDNFKKTGRHYDIIGALQKMLGDA